MNSEKNSQEKYDEIQGNLQRVIRKIIRDIAKTEGGRQRLRTMHRNLEIYTTANIDHDINSMSLSD